MNTNKNNYRSAGKNKNRATHKQSRRPKSTLDPKRLVQTSKPIEMKPYVATQTFHQMPIHKGIKANLNRIGFTAPTEIQEKTYQKLLDKKDLIGIAATGTGKTGAFLIPIIQNLLEGGDQKFQSLIIVPTRELALQVEEEFTKLSQGLGLKASCHIGGTNIAKDLKALRRFNHIVIGTPGRLLDLKDRGSLKLNQFEVLILDEFDRMLDMGFIRDIRTIVSGMKSRKQTMLFSATKDKKQQKLIDEIVQTPFTVEVNSGKNSSKNVDQDVVRLKGDQNKYDALLNLLKGSGFDKVILFAETKRLADRLSKKLNKSGVNSDQIHGNKSQNYRVKALDRFKKGKVRVLVATDVAARGIDVNDVTHVINYQIPRDFDTYIHRIGRTGRAGKKGMAFTFVD